MGLLSKLFGGEKEYPLLEPTTPGARRLEKYRGQLDPFVNKVADKLEMVPSEEAVYVFIGKPPGMFGVAWFEAGDADEHNFKTLMKKKGLSQAQVQVISDKLREAYEKSMEEPRYSATISGRKVLVTPSETLAEDVHKVIEDVTH